jgi:hypothetical protein
MFKIPEKELIKLNQVKSSNVKQILFVFPGIEGTCIQFDYLSGLLETLHIQVYGLEFTHKALFDSLELTTQYYLEIVYNKLERLRIKTFSLAGYSYGGLLALELEHQLRLKEKYKNLKLEHLILFETSHVFFNRSVHINAQQFDQVIPNRDIFADSKIYTGSLSIYLSFMIGKQKEKFKIYDFLLRQAEISPLEDLDDALDKSFDYVQKASLYDFDCEQERAEMKQFLRLLLLKSNSAFLYKYNKDLPFNLDIPVCLIKSKNFMYKEYKDVFYLDDVTNNKKRKIDFNADHFNLREIIKLSNQLKIYECKTEGNHYNFISQCADEIFDYLKEFLFQKSKCVKSKL